MTDQTHNTNTAVLIALDIAKNSHDVLIQYPSGKYKKMKIQNTHDGYESLIDASQADRYPVKVAFEPTADYHRNIAFWLSRAGLDCYLVSSLSCARAREMLFKTWDKNDRKDARVILYLMQQELMQPFHDPLHEEIFDIQELSNTYHQISLARTRCMNSLFNHYVTLYFPEIERFFNSTRAEWFCRFLLKFPTPQSITKYRCNTFVKRAWDVVGRKVAKERFLEELYSIAENSIGLPVEKESIAVKTFQLQIQRFLDLTNARKALEKTAENLLSKRQDYKHLLTLPGVGPIIALIIVAESGDLKRFNHYRQYLNFCGFDLSAQQSGSQKGSYHLSKRGNARLRYAFWLAATVAIRQNENSFRDKYSRYVKKDPDNKDLCRKARTAVAAKMARVAHSLVKGQKDYRGYYEFSHGT